MAMKGNGDGDGFPSSDVMQMAAPEWLLELLANGLGFWATSDANLI